VTREISIQRGHSKKPHRGSFLRRESSHVPAENERIPNGLQGAKDPKETGGSNPPRSSNEALRTVRAERWQARILDVVAAYPRVAVKVVFPSDEVLEAPKRRVQLWNMRLTEVSPWNAIKTRWSRYSTESSSFLCQVEPPAPIADDPAKAPSLGTCHFPCS